MPSVPARAPTTTAVRVARAAVALIVAGAVLLSIGYRLGPERFWSLALVEYLPYPIHLLPALGGILISFALGRVWRVAALLGLALVLWPVMGLELNAGDDAQGRKPVRVLTYNVKAYLAAGRPDGFAQTRAGDPSAPPRHRRVAGRQRAVGAAAPRASVRSPR